MDTYNRFLDFFLRESSHKMAFPQNQNKNLYFFTFLVDKSGLFFPIIDIFMLRAKIFAKTHLHIDIILVFFRPSYLCYSIK